MQTRYHAAWQNLRVDKIRRSEYHLRKHEELAGGNSLTAAGRRCTEGIGSVRASVSDGLSISLPRSSAFIGCMSQNVSYSNWLFWPTDPSTALRPATYSRVSPASPTWPRDDGCGLLHLTGLMYQPSVSLQSTGGRFRSLSPTSGTICRHTWHPRSHSRSSDNDSRHSCSLVHIRTFLFDLLFDILRGPCNS